MKTAALLLSCFVALPAFAQFTVNVQIGEPPPSEYIATTAPIYYEGHPCYFYDGYWRYRDARGQWRYYRQEPQVLYQHRREPPRHVYYENRRYAPVYNQREWNRGGRQGDRDRRDGDRGGDRRDDRRH
ncbi:MAG TPA: hypothetical protein VGH20_21890 [Myxococcales bacterium]|jgi:hypothetical protein